MFSQAIKSLPLCLLGAAALAQAHVIDVSSGAHVRSTVEQRATAANSSIPTKWGALIFPAFLYQDLIAVVDPLMMMSYKSHMELYVVAETMDPVSPAPVSASMNPFNSTFHPEMLPTHTFETAPSDLEVLIVPGGPGVRNPDVGALTDYIAGVFPNLKYLITVCTGAGLAAQAGVLDGYKATTNKASWDEMTAMGPNVDWVSPARWIHDGPVWTSSGVMAGMDLTFAFIEHVWNASESARVAQLNEYEPNPQTYDPFAELEGVPPQGSI